MNEDVFPIENEGFPIENEEFPIENGDFPASHVSLLDAPRVDTFKSTQLR